MSYLEPAPELPLEIILNLAQHHAEKFLEACGR